MFIDQAKITVRSGKGGDGVVSFRREKFIPRGGPDGGDGGRGGDVVVISQARISTLLRFRYEHLFAAENGGPGAGNNRHGKNGKDVRVLVPVGTVVYEEGIEEPLVDLDRPGMSAVIVRGGRGGRGNAHYANSVRQTPRFCERGEPYDARDLRLELKLLADVGLVGLPNAGKSTLLARVTAAKPKIADYPFTTLEPQLGVVGVGDDSFVMADLPGLITGAAHGKGMGLDFLRHAERCSALIHVLDLSGGYEDTDPWEAFQTINREVAEYGGGLHTLPVLVALNKLDLPEAQERLPLLQERLGAAGLPGYPISAATGEGVDALLFASRELVVAAHARRAEDTAERPSRTIVPRARREMEATLLDEGLWEVTGSAVERLLAMTDLGSDEGVQRLQQALDRRGVFALLRERGVKEGDTVRIRGHELTYTN